MVVVEEDDWGGGGRDVFEEGGIALSLLEEYDCFLGIPGSFSQEKGIPESCRGLEEELGGDAEESILGALREREKEWLQFYLKCIFVMINVDAIYMILLFIIVWNT